MRAFIIATIVIATILSFAQAFIPSTSLPKKNAVTVRSKSTPFSSNIIRFMSDEFNQEAEKLSFDVDDDGRKLKFDNNQRSRKGRTIDEDGKSNIWAFESKEEVEVTKGSGFLVLGAVLVAFVGFLTFLPQIQFPNYD